jgi:hypothetical protein
MLLRFLQKSSGSVLMAEATMPEHVKLDIRSFLVEGKRCNFGDRHFSNFRLI